MSFKKHLFICTHHKENGPSCSQKNSLQLLKALKEEIKTNMPELSSNVRVNVAGCLGQCARGGAAVLYPEEKWYFQLSNKAEELTQMLADIKNI